MKYTDRAFSLAKPLPKGVKSVSDIPVTFFTDALFSLDVSDDQTTREYRKRGWGREQRQKERQREI